MNYPLKQYIVTQKFGETITDPQGHTGIDLYQPIGTPVYAAEGGDILAAGMINNAYGNSAYGNCVLIDHHNKLYTFYAHMSTISVKTGMSVIAGATGNVTGPHLHFEVRIDPKWNRKNFIDPESVLGEAQKPIIDTGNSKPLTPDEYAIVANPILNLRSEAGYNGKQLGQLYEGTKVKICGAAIQQDGLTWYPVSIEGFLASFEGDTILLKKLT